jgi:hypothetical protein
MTSDFESVGGLDHKGVAQYEVDFEGQCSKKA